MARHRHFIDLKAIAWQVMEKYGFEPQFSKSVIREVEAINSEKIPDSTKEIKDLRSLLWSSIDNADSMDLDQLEYCEQGTNGEILVKVAIADVDFFVTKDSPTDRHAAHNGTSVYLGVKIFPLLPDQLSKGISSLLPDQDRRAMVIEYTVLLSGEVRHGGIYRALVTNKAKLVYEQVGDWLEGTSPIPRTVQEVSGLEEQIHLQAEASRRLRRHRMEQGALDLDTLEPEAVVDKEIVRGLVIQRQNAARRLIEEFMVASNGTMVNRLETASVAMIQRVVRIPRNWEGIVATAAKYKVTLPRDPDSKALAKFLDRQKATDPERFPDLSLTIVKLMGPGEYVAFVPGDVPIGHFALAVMDYTHSTAPNRRYVDIVNQRMLKSVLDRNPSPYSARELNDLSVWLTDREKASQKAERFMRKAAAAVLLRDRIGESFDGLVTGAEEKGTYVRIITPPVEGRVVRGERGLVVGQKVRVRLLKADPYNGFIDFECVGRVKNEQKMTR